MALRTYQYQGGTEVHWGLTQTVTLEGLQALRKLLNPPDELLAAPWKGAMASLVDFGAMFGRTQAPKGRTGKLQRNIKPKVQNKPLPMWAAVRSRGTRKRSKTYPRGYPYPRLLNYSPKHGHEGWFDRGVIEPVIGKADLVLAQAATEIARKWERG